MADKKDRLKGATGDWEIIIGMENVDQARLISVLEECVATNATVKVASPLYDVVPARLDMEKYGDIAVVGISRVGPGRIFEAYKRVFDTLVTALGLVFLLVEWWPLP